MHRFVFICGLHRSGTSLLHRALRDHPDISAFKDTGAPEDEGQHLQSVYPTGRVFGGPGKFCFEDAAHLTEASSLVTEPNRKKLFTEWSRYWDLKKPVLLEKSPPNIIRSRFLQAMFPESHFIFLTRHPIAVSLATQKWSNTTVAELVEHWRQAHDIMEADKAHLKKHITLRYEDLADVPDKTLKALYDFLELPAVSTSEDIQTGINEGYFKRWETEEYTASFGDNATRQGYLPHAPYVTVTKS